MPIVQFIQVYLLSQGLYDLNEAIIALFIFRNMFFKAVLKQSLRQIFRSRRIFSEFGRRYELSACL